MLPLPFIVLDQNALTRDAVLQPAIVAAREKGLQLMLTDAALIELIEADDWEARVRRGFAKLAPVRDLVTIAKPIPDLYRIEAAIGRPAYDQLEDVDRREWVRKLLVQSQTGNGDELDYMRAGMAGTKARVLPQYLNGQANKEQMQRYVSIFRKNFDSDARRKLADPAYRRGSLASSSWASKLEDVIAGMGFNCPGQLARGPSIIAHNIFSTALVAVKWCRNSGLDCAHADKITNDLIDTDYAVTASFCHGFASQDRNAYALWEDLVAIAELRS
jgi:hypothetical protein